MTLSLNTLVLCRQILGNQNIVVNASRDEINAVLDARDQLDAAIAEIQAAHPIRFTEGDERGNVVVSAEELKAAIDEQDRATAQESET